VTGDPGLACSPSPAGRLSPAELVRLVTATAQAEESWRPAVRFSAARRWFTRLDLTDACEVWLLTWLPGQKTGFHDHGDASGAFAVTSGDLRESLATPGSSRVRHRRAARGSVTGFGGQHLHNVGNVSQAPAISVHAYSPPLSAMRRYELTQAGLVLVGTDLAEADW
jgi:hypothetical protein